MYFWQTCGIGSALSYILSSSGATLNEKYSQLQRCVFKAETPPTKPRATTWLPLLLHQSILRLENCENIPKRVQAQSPMACPPQKSLIDLVKDFSEDEDIWNGGPKDSSKKRKLEQLLKPILWSSPIKPLVFWKPPGRGDYWSLQHPCLYRPITHTSPVKPSLPSTWCSSRIDALRGQAATEVPRILTKPKPKTIPTSTRAEVVIMPGRHQKNPQPDAIPISMKRNRDHAVSALFIWSQNSGTATTRSSEDMEGGGEI